MVEELSPAMRERYGLDRSPWPARVLSLLAVIAYIAVLVFVGLRLSQEQTSGKLLVWEQPLPDRVDVTFGVTRPAGQEVDCVLRAQDDARVDIGYAITTVPAGEEYVQQTYLMRTIGPAALVEVLGCGPTGLPLRVPQPGFPPGVVPPEQPWSDS